MYYKLTNYRLNHKLIENIKFDEKYKNKTKLLFFEPYTSKVYRGAI